ncbi:MAG: hypothetical protein OEZ06_08045 [Myxococcales bacterium]|nr:hypothetical protein [Myxococcales bacterium]
MAEKLERIFEYRVLVSKKRELSIPLVEAEQLRLERLERQLSHGVPALDGRDAHTLLPIPQPCEFMWSGHFGSGTVRNATGDGFAIATPEAPPLGKPLIVTLRDARTGIELSFPGRVVARVVRGGPSMGVALEGLPTKSRIGASSSGVYRTELSSDFNLKGLDRDTDGDRRAG